MRKSKNLQSIDKLIEIMDELRVGMSMGQWTNYGFFKNFNH